MEELLRYVEHRMGKGGSHLTG
ncbi:hypothetical protein M3J09_002801 [Ascochyta lentis]